MASYRCFLALIVFAFSVPGALAKNTLSQHKVNGYDVLIVNTHEGNTFTGAVNVGTGSWHDPLPLAGRAHLWEHTMFLGSVAYPGRHQFDEEARRLGVDFNAGTYPWRTFYHGTMTGGSLLPWLGLLGATFSRPAWNEAAFRDERDGPVKNEALEYQGQDSEAFSTSKLMTLLPTNHPLAMYNVGTQAQLDAMTMDDMREYYYSNYQPGNVQIIVVGNFDGIEGAAPAVTEAQVLAQIQQSFQVPVPPADFTRLTAPLNTRTIPDLIDPTRPGPRLMEMKASGDTQELVLTFQIDSVLARTDATTLETLLDYVRLDLPGSIQHLLKEEGLILSMGASPQSIDNLSMLQLVFELTPDGADRRYDVPNLFFAAMAKARDQGIGADIVAHLKSNNINSYERTMKGSSRVADYLAGTLGYTPPSSAFDFHGLYDAVTEEDLRAAINGAFNPARVLSGYMGPDVDSDRRSPIFDKPLRVLDGSAEIARWTRLFTAGDAALSAPVAPQLATVPLRFRERPLAASASVQPRLVINDGNAARVVLAENHTNTDGGYVLRLNFPLASQRTDAALALFDAAFDLRHAPEMRQRKKAAFPSRLHERPLGTVQF